MKDEYIAAIIESGAEVPTLDEDDWDFFEAAFGEVTESDIERVESGSSAQQ